MNAARAETLLREHEARALIAQVIRLWPAYALEAQLGVADPTVARVTHHGDVADEAKTGRVHRHDDLARAPVRGRFGVRHGHHDAERGAVRARREPLVAVDDV